MTGITSKVLVTAQENYIYVTGGNTTTYASVIKMLPNGNLYESYVKARKV